MEFKDYRERVEKVQKVTKKMEEAVETEHFSKFGKLKVYSSTVKIPIKVNNAFWNDDFFKLEIKMDDDKLIIHDEREENNKEFKYKKYDYTEDNIDNLVHILQKHL